MQPGTDLKLHIDGLEYKSWSPDAKARIWTKVDKLATSWEGQFSKAAAKALDHDKREVLAGLSAAKQAAKESKATVNWQKLKYDIDEYLRTNGADYWRELFTPLLEGVFNSTGEAWSTVLGMQFDVRNLAGEKWFEDYTLQFAQPINNTTSDGLHNLLAQGEAEGWAIPTVQSHIEQMFTQWMSGGATAEDFDWYAQRLPPYRTENIARTETMRMSNAGALNQFGAWGVGFKAWLGTPDDRERDSHRAAASTYDEGGTEGPIPINKPFIVGGSPMMQPGDGSMGAPISEIANCRCTLLPYTSLPAASGQAAAASIQDRLANMYADHGVPNVREQLLDALEKNKEKIAKLEAQHDKLGKQIDAITDQMTAVTELQNATSLLNQREQWDEYDRQWNELRAKRHEIMLKRQAINAKIFEAGKGASNDVLTFGTDAPVEFGVRSPALARNTETWKIAKETLSRLFDGSVYDSTLFEINAALTRKKRAFCAHDGTINVNAHSMPRTVIHESGHSVEDRNDAIHRACVQFLQYRTAGEEPVSMRKLSPRGGHYKWERTRPDKFPSYYSGAVYENPRDGNIYATEILSMGLEYLYNNPARFADEDPEYFDFIIGILRGWL